MYAKLFASLYQGTLRGCSDEILVFTNLIAHADSTGMVDKHWRAISEEVGISRERVEAAIANLEAPDPESRSPEEEGRRIIRLDEHRVWGWQIVNHGKYRSIRSEDDRREQNRAAQERWRAKNGKPRKPKSAQAEAEAEAEAEANKSAPSGAPVHPKGNGTNRRTSGTRLPADWKPSADQLAYARDNGCQDPEGVALDFCQYWWSKAGAGAVKTDWNLTWQTWCRKQKQFNGLPQPIPRAKWNGAG